MQCIHRIGVYTVQKEIKENPHALLTNTKGGFFYWQENRTSRYHGFFVRENGVILKTIAGLRLGVRLPAKRVTNRFSSFEIERQGGVREVFFLDPDSNSLVWQANEAITLSVLLDGKEIFDNSETGRFYEMRAEEGCVVIEFVKREDGSLGRRFFLAIAGLGGSTVKKEWIQEQYAWDRARNDPPFDRYVFHAADLSGKKFVFSVAQEKDAAVATAKRVYDAAETIKKSLDAEAEWFAHKHDLPAGDDEIRVAYLAAKYSLHHMEVKDEWKNREGLYAGIPWFAQFWLRDFAISSDQLVISAAHAIYARYLDHWIMRGTIHGHEAPGTLAYADTEGLFFRCAERLMRAGALQGEELRKTKELLVLFLANDLPARMRDGLVCNNSKETWMDTEYQGSGRQGARIEIQALTLAMFRFAGQLTGDTTYFLKEAELLRTVRSAFWDGTMLADGALDATQRPNVFLAYRFYPDLLLRHEWEKAFESVLDEVWLPWGGIASIAKTHPFFCGTDRGCDDRNRSYHHGNAWFFVNNYAALALFEVNAEKFQPFIDALLGASTNDILWEGALGHHSEVSSAEQYVPRGCLAQSWSAASYCDAIDRVVQSKTPHTF
ncbi:MAG: amylo-alpha-1,6-glucosidase [Patescibacteria group bacterium]